MPVLPVHHVYPRSLGRSAVEVRCTGAPAASGWSRLRLAGLTLLASVWCCAAPVEPFEGSATSLESLAEHVLDAVSRQDLAALAQVRLTEREHNDVVWPELPAAAPEVNFPVDFAWSNIETRNHSALARLDDYYEGRRLTLDGVECRGETEKLETFEVLTNCWVSFEVDDSAEQYEAQLFKDVLVRGGGFKIFRYYDEPPRRWSDALAP